jgi:SSS family solute:Na+ symporter
VTPQLTALVIYSAVLVGLGAWIGRKVAHTQGFFVSDRSLGPGTLAATLLAANIGSAATVGATSLAYQFGAAAWWWTGSAGIGSLLLAFVVGPRIWRTAKQHNLLTVGDFLEFHYDTRVRNLAALVIWLGGYVILCAQINGAGAVLAAAGHISVTSGCTVAALVMAAYFVSGGLRSAASVNVVQLLVKLVGFAIATPVALAAVGGLEQAVASHPAAAMFFRSPRAEAGWPALFLLVPAFLISPGILQKIYGARDERAVRAGVGINAVGLLLFAALPVLCGFAARAMFPSLDSPQAALPRLMADGLPVWIGGLALAAVFSAEMSAGDAVLFMLSTSGARDLYRGIVKPDASDAEVLRVTRVLAVVATVVGLGLTFYYQSVIGALGVFYSLLGASLTAPILGALFRPAGSSAALASMAVGIAVALFTQLWPPLTLPLTRLPGCSWMSPAFFGLAANLLTYLCVGLVSGRTHTPRQR